MVAQFTMGVKKIQSNLHVQWKIIKLSPQKEVAIAFEMWSFTRVSSNMALTEKILLFWIYGPLGEVTRKREVVAHGGSTVFHASNCPENKATGGLL